MSVLQGSADVNWEMFFQDPNAWWDNRTTKFKPTQPDFKHKDIKCGRCVVPAACFSSPITITREHGPRYYEETFYPFSCTSFVALAAPLSEAVYEAGDWRSG